MLTMAKRPWGPADAESSGALRWRATFVGSLFPLSAMGPELPPLIRTQAGRRPLLRPVPWLTGEAG